MFYFPVLCSGTASWPAHNGVCTAQTCLGAKAFLWAALEICVSTDFQDTGELAGRGLTLLETAKLSPQAKLLFFFFRTRTALLFCPPRAWEALLTWVVLLTGMGLLKFGGTGPRWEQWNIPWKIWCTPRNANSHRCNFSLYKILSSALFLFMHLLLWKMTCISKIR